MRMLKNVAAATITVTAMAISLSPIEAATPKDTLVVAWQLDDPTGRISVTDRETNQISVWSLSRVLR